MTAAVAEVPPEDDVEPDDGPEPIRVIESDPDEVTRPFRIAYRRGGERIEEEFEARVHPPFAIFSRLRDLEVASASGAALAINTTVRRLFLTALTDDSATRLLRLVEGDEDEVGTITPQAIGGIVDLIREMHFKKSPTPRGSSNGSSRTARTSSAAPSGNRSTSTRSKPKKR